jgi:hypothetical protein
MQTDVYLLAPARGFIFATNAGKGFQLAKV